MIRQIVLATKNRDKLRELKSLMRGSGICVLSLVDFPPCSDVTETGRTFEANARKKARVYSRHTHCLTLADDSGLMVNFLKGAPGVYSARFAGPGCTYSDNNRKLLKSLKGVPAAKRSAKFISVVAIYDNGRFVRVVRGECLGKIAFEEAGTKGFGYDPVFIPNGFKKTFAQIGRISKNRISHRGRALRKARAVILSLR